MGEIWPNKKSADRRPTVFLMDRYHVSRLDSVVTADGVTGVSFSNLEIRHARGGGVVIADSTDVVLDKCTISDHGS